MVQPYDRANQRNRCSNFDKLSDEKRHRVGATWFARADVKTEGKQSIGNRAAHTT
ncbi:hypothetical protein CAter10_4979 [Collimonas arenae]|nr:hypothetical protein CAter10_4979 [Collimonas arenae]